MRKVASGKEHEPNALQVRQALPPYRGMVDAVKQIAREEGLAGFYRGLGPSLLLVRRSCTGVLFAPAGHPVFDAPSQYCEQQRSSPACLKE
jgi:Mitochondrial carrier protein